MKCPACKGNVDMIGPGDWRAPVYRCYNNYCRWSGSINTPEAWEESNAATSSSRSYATALKTRLESE